MSKGTSNTELSEMAKCLNIPNFYCIMKDELKTLKDVERPLNLIINLENSDQNGSHWTLAYADDKQKIFYCTFGSTIPTEVKEFLLKIDDRPILTSDIQIQEFNTDTCGLLCILILYLLNSGQKFEE